MVRLLLRLLFVAWTVVAEDDNEHAFGPFLHWMQCGIDEAGESHRHRPLRDTFALQTGPFGNSLFSKLSFVKGELITLLPKSRLVRNEALSYPHSWGSTARIAAHIATARRARDKSFLKPYIDMLPSKENRPIYWKPSLLQENLVGSFFPEYVDWKNSIVLGRYQQAQSETGLLLKDFLWGWDMVASRAMGGTLMFPIFDLAQHGEPHNIDLRMEGSNLAVRALRPIQAGEEILNDYFAAGSQQAISTWDALENWGFILGSTKKIVKLQISLPEGQRRANFSLTDDVGGVDGRSLLRFLRRNAKAASRADRSGASKAGAAFAVGQQFVQKALDQYPQTVAEDEAILAESDLDTPVRYLIMLRRDEKLVLHWWLRLFSRCLSSALANEVPEDAQCYHEHTRTSLLDSMRSVLPFFRSLLQDLGTAGRHPVDFTAIIVSIIALPIALFIDVIVLVALRCFGRRWSGPRKLIFLKMDGMPRPWRGAAAVAAYALLAARCDPGLVWFVAERGLPFASLSAAVFYTMLRRIA